MEKLKHNFKYGAFLTIVFSAVLLVLTTIRWFSSNIFLFPMIVGIIIVFFSSKILSIISQKIKDYESKYFHKLIKKLEKYILVFILLIGGIFGFLFIFGLFGISNILLPLKKIYITILMGLIVVTMINLIEDTIIHKKDMLKNLKENIILLSTIAIIVVFMFFSAFNYSLNTNELQGELITSVIIIIIVITTFMIKIEEHRNNYLKESKLYEKNMASLKENINEFFFLVEKFSLEAEKKEEHLPAFYKSITSIDMILDISKDKDRELSKKTNEIYDIFSNSTNYFNIGKAKFKEKGKTGNIIGSNVSIRNRDVIKEKLETIKTDFKIYIKLYEFKSNYTNYEFNKNWKEIEKYLK